MKKGIILGIGNRLMEDDGVGNEIVEELIRRNAFPGHCLYAGETDIDFCLDALEGADLVILIDASNTGNEPCSVSAIPLKDLLTEMPSFCFPHHFDLLHALKQQGYQGDGILLTVEACSIQYHYGLSSEMEEQFPGITDTVYKFIENYIDMSKR